MLADVVSEITAGHQVDNQVKVVGVFKCIVHVHKESDKNNKTVSYL